MRHIALASSFLIAGGLTFGLGAHARPPVVAVPPPDGPAPILQFDVGGYDADQDGWVTRLDCNDDDPSVHIKAIELLNGIDDNCNGVVDERFDTTLDFPSVKKSIAIVPDLIGGDPEDAVSIDEPPRLLWMGDRFTAVWIDTRARLRLAQFAIDGKSETPPLLLGTSAGSMDVAWTGSRLAIAFEDTSTVGSRILRLMILDKELNREQDVIVSTLGADPRIVWAQDRFGLVWNALAGLNSVRFREYGTDAVPLSPALVLPDSGSRASIAYDGAVVRPEAGGTGYEIHEGMFGIAYEAQYAWEPSGDVLLAAFPRVSGTCDPIGPVRVNTDADEWSECGTIPTITANASGFLVAWHAQNKGADMAQARYFSHDTLTAVQEFVPDADSARYGRLLWLGSEFVMANDNWTGKRALPFDVHVRRFDATGNTHVTTPPGAWSEVSMRNYTEGFSSVHPDLAIAGELLGVIWVEQDKDLMGAAGRLWLAVLSHE